MLQPQVGHQQQEQLLLQQLQQTQLTQPFYNYLHGINQTHNSIQQFSQNNFLLPSLHALLLQPQQQPQVLQRHQQLSPLQPQDYQSLGIQGFSGTFPQRNLLCESLGFLQQQILPNQGDCGSNFSPCQFEQFQAATLQNYNDNLGQLLNIQEQNNLLYIGDNLKTLCHKLPPPPPPPLRELELLATQTQLFSLPKINQRGFRLVSKSKPATDTFGIQQSSIFERSAKINSPIDCSWQDSSTSKIPNDLEPFGFNSHDSCTLQTPNQSQDTPGTSAQVSTSSSNLNLESIKDITDMAKLKELGAKVFGSELSPSILSGTQVDDFHSNKRIQVLNGIESYLQTLDLKIDFKDLQNYSLFFHSKFPEQDIFPIENNSEVYDQNKSTKEPLLNPIMDQPLISSFLQQQQQVQTSNIQSTFINARRNKKREQKIKESLKSNSQLSTKFHNLTRLLMYKIVKIFRDEEKMTQFYELSPSLAASLKQVAGKLKQHSRDTCKSAVKTNFYTHSHYNVLFLLLNDETIKMLSKNPKDIEAHKYIFGLDLLDADPVKLSFANLIKNIAFKIVKISLQREIVEQEDLIGSTKEILNNSQNESENYIGNLRSAYFERAFQGIIKMNNGCLVNRF